VKVTTAAEMRGIDRRAIEEYGISGVVLMEAAGAALARACVEELGGDARGKRVVAFCGKGNNGGDGFVAARHLANAGAEVMVYTAAPPEQLKGDAAAHFAPLRRMPVVVAPIEDLDADPRVRRAELVIDAILGTGASGDIEPLSPAGRCVFFLRAVADSYRATVVAADIPTGVESDTGRVGPLAVRADRTVTFAAPKPGLLSFPGAEYVGRLTVADIGIPRALLDAGSLGAELTTQDWMRGRLPARAQARDTNKGTFGTVLVVAGAAGMAGAAVLSAVSALRAGAGLVMLAVPVSLIDTCAALAPEVILRPLPESPDRTHGGTGAVKAALELAENCDSVAIGPGMTRNNAAVRFVQSFVQQVERSVVVDADGLNALADPEPPPTRQREHPTVFTPHPGEAGRLLGRSTGEVQADRMGAAREAAARYKATVLLKGARTLVAEPRGTLFFNRLGSPALATAGSGDVLTGVIGALLAQGLDGPDAARAGAYLHALAGEICAREVGPAGTLAADVRDRLPRARQLLYDEENLDHLP
jgi:NAD(P)H-hydrate epimerase